MKHLWRLLKVKWKKRKNTTISEAIRGLSYPLRGEVKTYYSVQNYFLNERGWENIFSQ